MYDLKYKNWFKPVSILYFTFGHYFTFTIVALLTWLEELSEIANNSHLKNKKNCVAIPEQSSTCLKERVLPREMSLQDVQHVCHLDLRQSRLPNPKKRQHPKSQSKERRQLRTVMPRLRRRLKPLETPNEELFEVVIILCTW